MATRFELRAPNPKSNTYLVLAVSYMAMIDGIKAALGAEKTANELELSLSKKCGDADFYLEKDREYRSEKDVFEDFSEEERTETFRKSTADCMGKSQRSFRIRRKRIRLWAMVSLRRFCLSRMSSPSSVSGRRNFITALFRIT